MISNRVVSFSRRVRGLVDRYWSAMSSYIRGLNRPRHTNSENSSTSNASSRTSSSMTSGSSHRLGGSTEQIRGLFRDEKRVEKTIAQLERDGYSIKKHGGVMVVYDAQTGESVTGKHHYVVALEEWDGYAMKLGAMVYIYNSDMEKLTSGHHDVAVSRKRGRYNWVGQKGARVNNLGTLDIERRTNSLPKPITSSATQTITARL